MGTMAVDGGAMVNTVRLPVWVINVHHHRILSLEWQCNVVINIYVGILMFFWQRLPWSYVRHNFEVGICGRGVPTLILLGYLFKQYNSFLWSGAYRCINCGFTRSIMQLSSCALRYPIKSLCDLNLVHFFLFKLVVHKRHGCFLLYLYVRIFRLLLKINNLIVHFYC